MQITNAAVTQTVPSSVTGSGKTERFDFMASVDEQIAAIFEELSKGLDEETKFKRSMSLSLHLQAPMFMMFSDGNYPEGMPANVKAAMQSQQKAYNALESDEERNLYSMQWMIDHIGHEQSSDPAFKDFLIQLRDRYSELTGATLGDTQAEEESDAEVEAFREALHTKGALRFVFEYNQEKIDKMVEEYRQKLLGAMKANPEAQINIEEMVQDYREELLKRLQELEELENPSALHISRIASQMTQSHTIGMAELLRAI